MIKDYRHIGGRTYSTSSGPGGGAPPAMTYYSWDGVSKETRGEKFFELSNHLGNVLSVVSDRKLPVDDGLGAIAYYQPDVVSYSDYYPFGMQMPNRNGSDNADSYRYSFMGQEKDDEIKGNGNSLNFKYRMCDPRIARFFAVDPLSPQYPELTPYQFASNSPIAFKEIEGLEGQYYVINLNSEKPKLKFNKTVDYWLIPNSIETDYIVVEVPGPNNSYISYTFTGVAGDCPGCGTGNYIGDFDKFKEDPLGAIYSGEYSTDQEILGDIVKQAALAYLLGRAMRTRVPSRGTVPRTRANSTKGWKVGDPINNLTSKGNVPQWSTVRQRYWKNRANAAGEGDFSTENLARMKNGLAPQRLNPETGKMESMELHHTPPQREDGLFDFEEVWPAEHEAIDPYRNTGNGG